MRSLSGEEEARGTPLTDRQATPPLAGMFDHKSAAVTQAAAATAGQAKGLPAPPESPSRRKGPDVSLVASEAHSAESN